MRFIPLLLFAVFLFGCVYLSKESQIGKIQQPTVKNQSQPVTSNGGQQPTASQAQPEEVSFSTSDGLTIKGTFYPANSKNTVILVHQRGMDRTAYLDLPVLLQKEGFNVLAIDMRGHGESKNGLDLNTMQDLDYANIAFDLEAAVKYFKETKQLGGKLFVVGSSVSSNIVLNYGASNNVAGVVLLSPSWNYFNVVTSDSAGSISIPVLIIAGKGDSSYQDSQQIFDAVTSEKKFLDIEGDIHGNALVPFFKSQIVNWIKEH